MEKTRQCCSQDAHYKTSLGAGVGTVSPIGKGEGRDMVSDIDIFVILNKDAEEHKRKSIHKLASKVRQLFDDGIMGHSREAMAEKPLPGEPAGNCHTIALAFMADLIIAGQAQGWSWVQGVNANRKVQGKAWEHSWLEYGDYVIDATIKQKENPDQPTVSIGEGGFFYKAKGITKILKRRDAANTRKWLLKQARHEK